MKACWMLLCVLCLLPAPCRPAEVAHVAVASNYLAPMQQLARDFSAQTAIEVTISSGSTGKLYAQIVNGAPSRRHGHSGPRARAPFSPWSSRRSGVAW